MMIKKYSVIWLLLSALLSGSYIFVNHQPPEPPSPPKKPWVIKPQVVRPIVPPTIPEPPAPPPVKPPEPPVTPPSQVSTSTVINKRNPLQPLSYVPNSLVTPNIPLRSGGTANEKLVRNDVAEALEQMSVAANSAGITFNLQSGYRSYSTQVSLYNSYVSRYGQAQADTFSARPGHSEHQSGLAADLGGLTNPGCNIDACFASTVEGQWLAANIHDYGFIIRYPEGKQSITGYTFEPWHMRFVGRDISLQMKARGITTLEEFFGLPPAPDYQ